jgi:nitroreductase
MQEPFAQLIERTFSSTERTVIYRLIRSPQHVRHFASDPIPTDTLQRILNAAWCGASVGGQPPGQVILITSPALRTEITSVVHASQAGEAPRLSPRRSPRASWSLSSERMIAYLCLGFPQEFHRRRARKFAGWCPRRGLDTPIYNNVWGRLCELFPAPRVTFDDHDDSRQSE